MIAWFKQDLNALAFLGIALIFGLGNIYLTPPFQAPDENNHFHRTAHIASGHLMGETLEGNRLGAYLPSSYSNFSRYYNHIRKEGDGKFNQPYQPISDNINERIFVDFANVGYFSPTVYLPQAMGMLIVPDDVFKKLYIGRIAGFLFWLLVVFYAIRLIPEKKLLIAFIALLPASISINSALSGDLVTNSLSLLWLALMLKYWNTNKQIRWWPLLILSLVISINKLVYLPMVFLVYWLPLSRNVRWGIIISNIVLVLAWASYAKGLFISYDDYDIVMRDSQQLNPGVDPMAQLGEVLGHPFSFVKTFIVSYLDSAMATWAHYIGKFGWDKNYIPTVGIGALSLVLIGLSTLKKENDIDLNRSFRGPFLFVATLMIVLFSLVMYMQWSPVGNPVILNLSGRYFIPIVPFILFALPSIWSWRLSPNVLKGVVFTISTLGLVLLMLAVNSRFY